MVRVLVITHQPHGLDSSTFCVFKFAEFWLLGYLVVDALLSRGVFILAVGFQLFPYIWEAISVKTFLLKLQSVVVSVLVQQLVLTAGCRAWIVSVEIFDV